MENELDPRLQEMLKAYGGMPERDPQSAQRNQERFVAILNMIFDDPPASQPLAGSPAMPSWISKTNHFGQSIVSSIGRRAILIGSAVLIVLAVLLFGGMGITAYAASSSLPGDPLYSFKTTMENAQASLAMDPATEARLYMEFAGRRLSEIQSLIDIGRYADIAQAATEFNADVQKALNTSENLSRADPPRAIALNEEIAASLRGYSDILMQMLNKVPAETQPVVQSSIDAALSAAGLLDVEDDSSDDEDDDSVGPAVLPTSTSINSTSLPASTMTSSPVILTTGTPVGLPASTAVIIILPTNTPPSLPAGSPTSPVIVGGDVICQGSIGDVNVANLLVQQGASCTLNGTTVDGTIKVESGSSLTAQQITVNGNIQAEGASFVGVFGSTVGGSIQIKQGGSASIESMSVIGDIQFESNAGALSAIGNQVGGNIQVFKNSGGANIANNIIHGNLQCKENDPTPRGGNNSVQGNKEEQCMGL